MTSHMQDIAAFHNKFGLAYNGPPRALPKDLRSFREDFIREEFREYVTAGHALSILTTPDDGHLDEAEIAKHLEDQLDALVDMVYVILGAAYLHGYELKWQEAWNRVHEANMKKVRANAENTSTRSQAFDVVKPKGWVAPDHSDLVELHAHREVAPLRAAE
jgi:predicted HAD superfamily Cof-like phosphohydrolase